MGRCDMAHLTPRPSLPLVLRARTFQFAISGALMPAIYTLGNWPHTVWTVDGWEPTVCNDPPFQVDWVRDRGGGGSWKSQMYVADDGWSCFSFIKSTNVDAISTPGLYQLVRVSLWLLALDHPLGCPPSLPTAPSE